MSEQRLSRRKLIGSSGVASQIADRPPLSEIASTATLQPQRQQSSSPPNLILFMPNELRAEALSCYGNQLTRTPKFDKLAQEGTRFASCHVQFPVCGASRCSLLTGWPTSARGHRSLFQRDCERCLLLVKQRERAILGRIF